MKEVLEELKNRVNERVKNDEKFAKKLSTVRRSFLVIFDGKESYNFQIAEGKVGDIVPGNQASDIEISVDSDTFNRIIARQIDPMAAYMEKKIKIKASLFDKLFLTELFK